MDKGQKAMEKVVKIFKSFEEQEVDDVEYWKNLSGDRKLEVLEIMRANYWAMNNETPGRLQRVYRIVGGERGDDLHSRNDCK